MSVINRTVDGVQCTIIGFHSMSSDELKNYIDFVQAEIGNKPSKITVQKCLDGMIDLSYESQTKFERIRRI